ncbi:hypothetical protein BJZ21_001547 [Nocardioides panaciterrulae]|uniref:Uncharacterized protein n=1 Tax=Nocardioides panaciterrulae TaxID=661492 RepID=A0A7Y9E577_9ACTN|nr:hypothetical protein [Nocardioides panaciterrulae]
MREIGAWVGSQVDWNDGSTDTLKWYSVRGTVGATPTRSGMSPSGRLLAGTSRVPALHSSSS